MALLELHHITKSFGENLLLQDAVLAVEKNERVGLIGANGAGKTTLFKMIIGSEPPDSGQVVKAAGLKIGYLEQHACKGSSRTAYEEAVQVFAPLIALEQQLEQLNRRLLSEQSAALIEQQARLTEAFHQNGGLTYKNRTTAVLSGLGFGAEKQQLPVEALSGGQRAKIGLAKLLLCQNDLILLDEPTNHLDIDAVTWLEDYILSCNMAAVIISHDRYFLDKVTNKTAEIDHARLFVTKGGFSKYQALKEQRLLSESREYENKMREIHRLQGIVEQQRRWNREKNIKTAESKLKQIERIEKTLVTPENEQHRVNFSFPCAGRCGETVLSVVEDSCLFDSGPLYQNVSFTVRRGERVFLVGPNGVGKTTLIKRIMAQSSPNFQLGVGVLPAYFEQFQEGIDPNSTPMDEIHSAYPQMGNTAVRNALAAFEFYGDDVFRRNSTLSGGERARVAICKIMLSENNFLILDEPTNHLDITSSQALEQALKLYEGTLLIVSHDRYFMNRLADRIVYLRPEGSITVDGNYDDFLRYTEQHGLLQAEKASAAAATATPKKGKEIYLQNKKNAAKKRQLERAVEKQEAQIAALEQQQQLLNAKISAGEEDYTVLMELTDQLQGVEQALEQALQEWDAAAEQLAELTETEN